MLPTGVTEARSSCWVKISFHVSLWDIHNGCKLHHPLCTGNDGTSWGCYTAWKTIPDLFSYMSLSFELSIHRYILSLSFSLPIIYPSIHPIHLIIHPYIHFPNFHPPVCLSILPSTSICLSVYLSSRSSWSVTPFCKLFFLSIFTIIDFVVCWYCIFFFRTASRWQFCSRIY